MILAKQKRTAMLCLLTTALVWGLMWVPFRALQAGGVSNWTTSLAVYLIATMLGLSLFWPTFRSEFRFMPVLLPMMLAFGWCNFSYSWALTEGPVVRVLLLFYLSPLWTALLARLILHERLTRAGYGVVAGSLAGCVAILWRPGVFAGELPLSHVYEWLALSGGMAFSLGNVLSRSADKLPLPVKSAMIWLGVVVFAAGALLVRGQLGAVLEIPPMAWAVIAALGVTLLCTSVISQHGVSLLPANQVMALMLMELVFAAATAWLLAGETVSIQEWLGGALIVLSSLFSGRMSQKSVPAASPAPA
ncbi:DMT family transporter [Craterilacuibacter sp.]|uniref:DMT family transporter n=1 Tax=Craterilacuibacter sp. TaxID=2870909 RepID=UPI003F2D31DE